MPNGILQCISICKVDVQLTEDMSSGEEGFYPLVRNNHVFRRPKLERLKRNDDVSDSSDANTDNYSTCSDAWEKWDATNERRVREITLHFFYQPRTLTLLGFLTLMIIYFAFVNNPDADLGTSVWRGFLAIMFVFLAVGLLVFPNGPFIRPHPAIWRLIFGVSTLYLFVMVFVLFQKRSDVLEVIYTFDPDLRGFDIDWSEFTPDCSFKFANIWTRIDYFIPAHFFGWMYKALIIRNWGIVFACSVTWECTEMFFAHILPNFVECWWDIILLDLLICNGLGMACGMYLVRKLEVRAYHWESIKDIRGTRGKISRAVLQFTPENWTHERWMDPSSGLMRLIAVFVLIFSIQMTDLNAFLLKRVLGLPVSHPLNTIRIAVIAIIGAPSMRQYYTFVTDRTCKRLGTQAWIFYAIMIVELLVSIKYGAQVMPRPAIPIIICWFIFQLLLGSAVLIGIVAYRLRKHHNELKERLQKFAKKKHRRKRSLHVHMSADTSYVH